MAIGIGQTSKGTAPASAKLSTTAVNTSASGSTFVVGFACDSGSATFSSMSDTIGGSASGNTWTQIGTNVNNPTGVQNLFFYSQNAAGGTTHVFTANFTGTPSFGSIYVAEITGAAAASFDKSAGPTADASSPFNSGATATTTQANELLIGFMGGTDGGSNPDTHASSGSTPSAGWTILSGAEELDGTSKVTGGLAYVVVSSTGAYNWSYTESSATNGTSAIATFKEAAGGAINLWSQSCL